MTAFPRKYRSQVTVDARLGGYLLLAHGMISFCAKYWK